MEPSIDGSLARARGSRMVEIINLNTSQEPPEDGHCILVVHTVSGTYIHKKDGKTDVLIKGPYSHFRDGLKEARLLAEERKIADIYTKGVAHA